MTAQLVRNRVVSLGLASGDVKSGPAWVAMTNALSDAIDAPQVAAYDRQGLAALAVHGGKGPLRAGVQVLVRGVSDGYSDAAEKAEAVWWALHRSQFGRVLSLEGNGNPVWVGYTDTNQPRWSMDFIAYVEQE